jgi:hypothetical protein
MQFCGSWMNWKPVDEAEKVLGGTLQRLPKFLEANGAEDPRPKDRVLKARSLVRAVYRFRDATLVAEKKDDFANALQNLYREVERAEKLVEPAA